MSLAAAPIELSDGDRVTLERWLRGGVWALLVEHPDAVLKRSDGSMKLGALGGSTRQRRLQRRYLLMVAVQRVRQRRHLVG